MNSTLLSSLFGSATFWMPTQASNHAHTVDNLFYFILYLCTFFFILIVSVTVWFAYRYRQRSADQKTSPVHHNTKLEIWWTAIPSVLLLVLFLWGFKAWMGMNVPPTDAMEIRVQGRQWNWLFSYPREGVRNQSKMVVPVNTNVKLIMSSEDVLHSFFIPEFRIKRDVLPGRYTVVWFRAIKKGTFNIFCTEYCGKDHSVMLSRIQVVSKAKYDKWAVDARSKGVSGKQLVATYGCTGCHSLNGDKRVGPTFKGLYGRKAKYINNEKGGVLEAYQANDDYIRKSILYPKTQVVQGYAAVMNTYKGTISDAEINIIIDYLKKIGSNAKAAKSAKKK